MALVATVTPAIIPEGWTSLDQPQQFPSTQMGNAERLVARFGHQIRYCHTWASWLIWNGQRWKRDAKDEIMGLAMQTVRAIRTEREADYRHAEQSEKKAELKAMIELAQSMSPVATTSNELDQDPLLFNCHNGTIDLRTGKLRKHNPRDLLTKISPVEFAADAKCPRWLQFLDEVFAGDKELISFMQRALGCALTGKPEKAVFFLVGNGDNGKTTLLEVFRDVIADYSDAINIKTLMQASPNNEQQYALAKLEGKRFVTASEAKEGQELDEGLVKQLSGLGQISARNPYGRPFSYEPQFKLFIDANYKPTILGTDSAIWARVKIIPFLVKFVDKPAQPGEKQKDKGLRQKLQDESSGILAWAVQGCLEWQQHGLNSPKAVRDAVESYRAEMDAVGEFLGECCTLDPKAEIASAALYDRYKGWCGEKPMGQNAFGSRLEDKGFEKQRTSKSRAWKGLRLKS
jgi:putative DNA primase/helicase